MIYNAITCSIKFEVYITKAGSLSTVGLCFQLLIKQNVAMAVVLNCCSKTCAWSITCYMFYNHLLSPLSQLKWVPDHMLVGLQLVQEHWVLVQSILCAAANVDYVILDVEHLFNHFSDSITHLSVLIITGYAHIYVHILSLPSFYVHSYIHV